MRLFIIFIFVLFLYSQNKNKTVEPTVTYTPFASNSKKSLSNIKEFKLIKSSSFEYPKYLYEKGIEGYVILKYSVDENGKTFDHEIVESDQHDIYGPIAIENVSNYLYRPRTINDQKVIVLGVTQKIKFCFPELRQKQNFIFEKKSKECEYDEAP